MNKIHMSLLLVLLFAGITFAQECGPSCPVCSGAGNNDGALLSQRTVMISGLSIPTADEERAVLNARYGILSWLDAGVGPAVFRLVEVTNQYMHKSSSHGKSAKSLAYDYRPERLHSYRILTKLTVKLVSPRVSMNDSLHSPIMMVDHSMREYPGSHWIGWRCHS